ncbi:MAG TPA: hypothetical protein VFJ14_17895 [Nocardioidaceae bacterium]|nr:hypothetical protein [Nocardioidaceae bacterium]
MCLLAAADWSWLAYLGPFAPAAAVGVGAILYLRHELTAAQARLAKMADDRLALAREALPLLASTTEAVRASTSVIEQHSSALGESSAVISECRRALERAVWVLERFERPERPS